MKADMENHPFTRHTFNPIPRGHGSDFEIVSGSAGSAIYQRIIGDVSNAGRGDVINAINNLLLAGTRTSLGDLVLDVARELAVGTPEALQAMTLPPEAGGDLTGTRFEKPPQPDSDDLTGMWFERTWFEKLQQLLSVPHNDLPSSVTETLEVDVSDPIGALDLEECPF
jgi:hypothetical protein